MPPLPNTLVCNLGDMLDLLTRGAYRSTPHRVSNRSGRSRISFPFFFEPGWDSVIRPLPEDVVARAAAAVGSEDVRGSRWDGVNLSEFTGTYGEYNQRKVAKIFPQL